MRHTVVTIIASLTLIAGPAAGQASLRGSPASVDLMYNTAEARDLRFLQTPEELYAAALSGALKLVTINDDLELGRVAYPFVLPNTLRFADSLAAVYHAACGERIVVTSGARPLDEQPRNSVAKSVHPTGMAIDFRKPRTPACLQWLRTNLLALENEHVIEATEEQHPAHFHVAVLHQLPEKPIAYAAGDIVIPKTPNVGQGALNRYAAATAPATPAATRDAHASRPKKHTSSRKHGRSHSSTHHATHDASANTAER